jgi:hypothetical protein
MRVEPRRIVYRADSRADRWIEEVEESRWLDTWSSHMHIGEGNIALANHQDCTPESHDADQRKARLAIAGEAKPYAVIFFNQEGDDAFNKPPTNLVVLADE